MRRRWKVIGGSFMGMLVGGVVVGWWYADRTIIARMAEQNGFEAAQKGNHQIAEERLSAAIRKFPSDSKDSGRSHTYRARTRIELGRFDEALADADHALRIDPAYTLARTFRGAALYKLGRYDEAERDLDASLARETKSVPAQYYRGLVAERKGRLDMAEAHYRAAIDHNSAFARGFAGLSRVRRAQGDEVWADMFARWARERSPNVSLEIE